MGMGIAAFAGHQRSYRFTTDLLAATTLKVKVATQEYLISSILELILSDLCIHLIGDLVMPPRRHWLARKPRTQSRPHCSFFLCVLARSLPLGQA